MTAAPSLGSVPPGERHSGLRLGRVQVPPVPQLAWSSRPSRQYDLALVTRVKAARLPELERALSAIDAEQHAYMGGATPEPAQAPLWKVNGLHYARWVILYAEAMGGAPPQLVLSLNLDASESDLAQAQAAALDELFLHCGEAVRAVYCHCEAAPARTASDEDWLRYLHAPQHRQESATFYVGAPGRSLRQIRAEQQLATRCRELLAVLRAERELEGQSATAIRDQLRECLSAELPPPFPAQPDYSWQIWLGTVAVGVAVLATLPVWLLALGILRWKEATDPVYEPRYSELQRAHDHQVAGQEDYFLQNQLSHLVPVKPGWFRQVTLGLVFFALRLLAKYKYNRGKLGGIPSIHFARWMQLNEGKYLLFFSNFDGSWESYLGDFIDKASLGLTGVWSNTCQFPRTRFLLFAGSQDEVRFKAVTRANQIMTQVWYAAYPGLSIRNVNDNTLIRRGLADPTCLEAEQWLRLL